MDLLQFLAIILTESLKFYYKLPIDFYIVSIFTEKILALNLITCHIKGEFSALVEKNLTWYVCQ